MRSSHRVLGWAYVGAVMGVALAAGASRTAAQCVGQWLPGGGLDGPVRALSVYNGELVAGGDFMTGGGVAAEHVARWNGISWRVLGTGTDAPVHALTTDTPPGGPSALIAGGDFTLAGDMPANGVAWWFGGGAGIWGWFGAGIGGGYVKALTAYDGGLIAGGSFDTAGGRWSYNVARWDWASASWQAQANGLGWESGSVHALTVYSGKLIAGGSFSTPTLSQNIAIWEVDRWVSGRLERGTNGRVMALAVYHNPQIDEDELIVGGHFNRVSNVPGEYDLDAWRIARWNDTGRWRTLGVDWPGTDGPVYALTVYKGKLIVGGLFNWAGGEQVSNIASWDGRGWEPLGSGTNDAISALTVYHNPQTNQDELVAGGYFTTAGGQPSAYWARWVATVAADFGCDGDVDLTDFVTFQACFNGPNRPPAISCSGDADFDNDGDVDLSDFAVFQACFNGPNRPAGCP